MAGMLSVLFGKKLKSRMGAKKSSKVAKKSSKVAKKPSLFGKRMVVVVGGKKRKIHRGKDGGLYYRTKSGRHYVSKKELARLRRKAEKKVKKAAFGKKSRKSVKKSRKSSKKRVHYGRK